MTKGEGKVESRTLLIIEDESDIISMTIDMLDQPGRQILTARNGVAALDILKQYPVDAILSDIRMPHMTGIEMTKRVRAMGLATPVLLMSGHSDLKTTLEAMRAGVLDVIEKPFQREKMVAAVEHALVLGSGVRRMHTDIKKFCEERRVDSKYVDMMRYMSIFFAQQEVERVQREALKTEA